MDKHVNIPGADEPMGRRASDLAFALETAALNGDDDDLSLVRDLLAESLVETDDQDFRATLIVAMAVHLRHALVGWAETSIEANKDELPEPPVALDFARKTIMPILANQIRAGGGL